MKWIKEQNKMEHAYLKWNDAKESMQMEIKWN